MNIAVETTYWKDSEADSDAEYQGRPELMEIIRSGNEEVIEFAIQPDAQAKTNDRLYIRVPALALMDALTRVMIGKEVEL